MYRLATKCTTKKRSEKRHKCLWSQAYESNTHGSFVNNDTLSMCRELQVNAAEVCGLRTHLLADADPQ